MTVKRWSAAASGVAAISGLLLQVVVGQPSVIGQQITVTAGPGTTGTVIGKRVEVTAGPGTSGNVVGEQITVTTGGQSSQPATGKPGS